MNLNQTPKGMRTVIAFLGRRNAGKSSLVNALVGYDLAIVSSIAGTTTDPVNKAVEISPLGPCLVIDTAGLDDQGELGKRRTKKTWQVIADTDIGLIVIGDGQWTPYENEVYRQLKDKGKPVIAVINKSDLDKFSELETLLTKNKLEFITVSATEKKGIKELKSKLSTLKNISKLEDLSLTGDLINQGDVVVLVVPIDSGAPKGRLILPQVQTIRDILDHNAVAIVTKENELPKTLDNLGKDPRLVIADSQVVLEVSKTVPANIPLTTFSILFARFKGDLGIMVEGAQVLSRLQVRDKILIAEACTHHPLADDIGRIKIPRLIKRFTGKELLFDMAAGPVFPDTIEDYSLIIQCGGCTISRTAYMNRIEKAREKTVPITNYGVAISYVQGVLGRAIAPFPEIKAQENLFKPE